MSDFKERTEQELISTSLDVEQIDVNLFRSKCCKSLWIPIRSKGVFGGQVISQALVSATRSVDPEYALHSLHCYFLLSASAAIPILYYVERTRHGRSYTTRTVKASQTGKTVFIMICSFHKLELHQVSHQVPSPSNMPSPEDVQPEEVRLEELAANETSPGRRLILEQISQDRRDSPIEARLALEQTVDGVYTIMWWMRARKARGMPDKFEQTFQKCILAYLSDFLLIITPFCALGLSRTQGSRRQTMRASLDHSIYYYSHDFDCSEWLLYVMTSPVSGMGRGVAQGRVRNLTDPWHIDPPDFMRQIYTQSGSLIAVVSQEGIIRVDPREEVDAAAPKL